MNIPNLKIYDDELLNSYLRFEHGGYSPYPCSLVYDCVRKWFPRRNIYHSATHHIIPMLEMFGSMPIYNVQSEEYQFIGFFFALFHDCKPTVEESLKVFNDSVDRNSFTYGRLFDMVEEAIQATEYKFDWISDLKPHVAWCVTADTIGLNETDVSKIIAQERLTFREYANVEYTQFVEKRLEILDRVYRICDLSQDAKKIRFDVIKNFNPRIAVFPGTFDPFHVGHMNILKQAEKQFDKVIVIVGHNKQKPNASHDAVNAVRKTLKHHQVEEYTGFLNDFISTLKYDVTLIRGLRNIRDFEYEKDLRYSLQDIRPDIKIVYYVCDQKYTHISSTLAREYDGDVAGMYTDIPNYEKDY